MLATALSVDEAIVLAIVPGILRSNSLAAMRSNSQRQGEEKNLSTAFSSDFPAIYLQRDCQTEKNFKITTPRVSTYAERNRLLRTEIITSLEE
jgi:hypothetical protein